MESCCSCVVTADIPQLLSSILFSLSLSGSMPEFGGLACNWASEGHEFLCSRRRGSACHLPGNKCLLVSTPVKNPMVCTHWPHGLCCHLCWWEERSPERIKINFDFLYLGTEESTCKKQETTPSLKHILRGYPKTEINKINIPREWVSM